MYTNERNDGRASATSGGSIEIGFRGVLEIWIVKIASFWPNVSLDSSLQFPLASSSTFSFAACHLDFPFRDLEEDLVP